MLRSPVVDGDFAERRRADGLRNRAVEDRRIGQIERFAAEFEPLVLGHRELLARATG